MSITTAEISQQSIMSKHRPTDETTMAAASTVPSRPSAAHGGSFTYTWSNLNVYSHSPRGRCKTFLQRLRHSRKTVEISTPDAGVHLLRNVSGVARAGQLLAIMGSSGAGKTTLLNTLAFRRTGNVRVADGSRRCANGSALRSSQLRAVAGYVEQVDVFFEQLTAREHLLYQAELRLDRRWTVAERRARADEVMQELSLTRCANTVIGTPGDSQREQGLSGGERKRLSFATETLCNPALLICDEPTSGLDSFMSLTVVQVLQRLAREGSKTVIVTIHQPSSELLSMFDRLLLVAAGRVAFSGTLDEAMGFFESVGAPCPANYSPTDHFVQTLGVRPDCAVEDRVRIDGVCDAFARSTIGQQLFEEAQRSTVETGASKLDEDVWRANRKLIRRTTWCTQFWVVFHRAAKCWMKEPRQVQVRFATTVIISLLIGSIYWQQSAQLTDVGTMNTIGAMFMILTTFMFQNIFTLINVYCEEMPVFMRESRSNLYSIDAYFLAKTVAELPLYLMPPLLGMSIMYPMIGFRLTLTAIWHAFALITTMANVAAAFSQLMSCAAPTLSFALALAPPVTVPVMLFGGYFLNTSSVPLLLCWCPYISWLRYAFEGWMIVQWRDYGAGSIECVSVTECWSSGAHVLQNFHFTAGDLWLDHFGLGVLFIGMRLAAYLALVLRTRSKD